MSKNKILLAITFVINFLIYYFLFKYNFYLAMLALINFLYFYLQKKFFNIGVPDNLDITTVTMLEKRFLQLCVNIIFTITVATLFFILNSHIYIHIIFVVLVTLYMIKKLVNHICALISQYILIESSYELIKSRYSTSSVLCKDDILDVIKSVKLSPVGKYHGVIIVNKVLPENISQQQKEELNNFFTEAVTSVTCKSISIRHTHIGQYSDDQFIICISNANSPDWKYILKTLNSYNTTNTKIFADILTSYTPDQLENNKEPILPITYSCAYHTAKFIKPVSLEQLYKKACKLAPVEI